MLTFLPQVIFSLDSLQQSLVTVACLTSHREGVTKYSQGTCLEISSSEVTSLMMGNSYLKSRVWLIWTSWSCLSRCRAPSLHLVTRMLSALRHSL